VEVPWAHRPAAILLPYLGGQAGGSALADVLFGDAEPGGRLAETWPAALADVPSDENFPGMPRQVQYREGLNVGYRYFTTAHAPVRFCFGHGLSYTTFRFGAPVLSAERVAPGEGLSVTVPVRNSGARTGSAVVQLYVRKVEGGAPGPDCVLGGFAKLRLEPGESRKAGGCDRAADVPILGRRGRGVAHAWRRVRSARRAIGRRYPATCDRGRGR